MGGYLLLSTIKFSNLETGEENNNNNKSKNNIKTPPQSCTQPPKSYMHSALTLIATCYFINRLDAKYNAEALEDGREAEGENGMTACWDQ